MRKTAPKRSIVVNGRNSSISLEDEFWKEALAIAAARKVSIGALITEIDQARGAAASNLSSAVRVFVLNHYYKGTGAA